MKHLRGDRVLRDMTAYGTAGVKRSDEIEGKPCARSFSREMQRVIPVDARPFPVQHSRVLGAPVEVQAGMNGNERQ